MRLLLDENIPLQLYWRLREAGHDVEHIIALGNRGLPDSAIMQRLDTEWDLIFLTQDTEFFEMKPRTCKVIVSRIPQSIPVTDRVDIWREALGVFLEVPPAGAAFELNERGEILPRIVEPGDD